MKVKVKAKQFVTVPLSLITEPNLSNDAKYLYVVIRSLSGYNFVDIDYLRKRSMFGINKTYKLLHELDSNHWILLEKIPLNNNLFEYSITLLDKRIDKITSDEETAEEWYEGYLSSYAEEREKELKEESTK